MVPNLKIFIFVQNVTTREIRGRWFQIWQKFFQIPAPKYRNLAFLVPNLRVFIFCTNLCNKTNSRALIANITMAFQHCSPKHSNKAFLIPNLRICTKLCNKKNWRALIANITIVFQHSSPKTQIELFGSKFIFFSFWVKVYIFTNSRVLIKDLILVFIKLQPKNI